MRPRASLAAPLSSAERAAENLLTLRADSFTGISLSEERHFILLGAITLLKSPYAVFACLGILFTVFGVKKQRYPSSDSNLASSEECLWIGKEIQSTRY